MTLLKSSGFIAFVASVSWWISSAPPADDDRPAVQSFSEVRTDYKHKRAIVIGINHYDDPALTDLTFAANDAAAVGLLLETHFGYEVIQLIDHGDGIRRTQILSLVDEWLQKQQPQESDATLIYFAGHGTSGHILSTDSRPGSSPSNAIPLMDLVNLLGRLRGHKALLLDSCYAGTLFQNRPTYPVDDGSTSGNATRSDGTTRNATRSDGTFDERDIIYYMDHSAFHGLVAGRETRVDDGTSQFGHSPFTHAILEELASRCDSTRKDHVFTLTDLGLKVRNRVGVLPGLVQIPDFGRITDSDGEYVFRQVIDVDTPTEREKEKRGLAMYAVSLSHAQRLAGIDNQMATAILNDPRQCPPAYRGIEWNILRSRSRIRVPTIYPDKLQTAGYIHDGRVYSVNTNGTLQFWDGESWTTESQMPLREDAIFSVGTKGELIATASMDGTLWLHDFNDNQAARNVHIALRPTGVTIHRNVNVCVVAFSDGTVTGYNINDLSPRWTSRPFGEHATAASFYVSETRVAVQGLFGLEVTFINTRTGQLENSISGNVNFGNGIAFSGREDSDIILSTAHGGKLEWCNSDTGTIEFELPLSKVLGSSIAAEELGATADGAMIAVATASGSVVVLDFKERHAAQVIHTDSPTRFRNLRFSPDSLRLTAIDQSGTLYEWSLGHTSSRKVINCKGYILSLAGAGESERAVIGTADGTVIQTTATGMDDLRATVTAAVTALWHPGDESPILFGTESGDIGEISAEGVVNYLYKVNEAVVSLGRGGDTTFIVTATGRIAAFTNDTQRTFHVLHDFKESPTAASLSPSGRLIAVSFDHPSVCLVETDGLLTPTVCPLPALCWALSFSTDERRLYCGLSSGECRICDVRNLEVSDSLVTRVGHIWSLDARTHFGRIVVGGSNGMVEIFDGRTQQSLLQYALLSGDIVGVQQLGKQGLAVANGSGTVALYRDEDDRIGSREPIVTRHAGQLGE